MRNAIFIHLFTQHFTALHSQMLPKCQDEEMIFNEVTTPIHLPLFKISGAFLSLLADEQDHERGKIDTSQITWIL